MSSPARMYIWPHYVLEANGKRVTLPPKAGAALARLFAARGGYVPTKDMINAVYGDCEDGGPLTADNCIRVTMHRSRRLLKKFGLAVECKRGRETRGYQLIVK